MNTEPMSYVGRKPGCGCIVAAVVDDPDKPDVVAKDVQGFIRWGLQIERVSTEYVRQHLRRCRHKAATEVAK